jgi:hypothetical protein
MFDDWDWGAQVEKSNMEFWNSMSKEDQLKAFCAVVSKIAKAELDDRRSYRGVLYDEFQFGPESYIPAQISGYLDLHNSIVPFDQKSDELMAFCVWAGLGPEVLHNYIRENF